MNGGIALSTSSSDHSPITSSFFDKFHQLRAQMRDVIDAIISGSRTSSRSLGDVLSAQSKSAGN